MKKILTASLVAMMAVTAANADIASTGYVNKKLTGDAENSTLSFTGAAANQTTLQGAVNAIADSLSQNLGEGGNVSQQIQGAIQGLTGEVDGSGVVTSISQTNGKVTATLQKIGNDQVEAISQEKITGLTDALGDRQLVDNIVPELNIAAEANKVDTKYPSVKAAYKIVEDGTKSLTEGFGNVTGTIGADSTETFKGQLQETVNLKNANTVVQSVKILDKAIDDVDTALAEQMDADIAGSLAAQIKDMKDTSKQGSVANTVAGIETDLGTVTSENMGTTASNVADAIKEVVDEKADKADTLAGYGIGDAYTKTETESAITTKIEGLVAEAEVAGTNDGSYVTAVAQTDGKIKVSTVAFDTALDVNSTNAVQNKVVDSAIKGIKTNLGGLDGKNIASVPTSCAAGGNGTCSLVMKNGVATWEVVQYE
ncbi:MAG: hypothetical protein J6R52_03395 [Alphaproteobacteria bacterium]|nr:hypothetical protein [Alphaproteobacteria bacterium]